MGEFSQKSFTTDKLKKFGASGNGGNVGQRDRDKAANSDDFGRAAAKGSDSSAFATGGAAKAPSLGRAARAGGGRVGLANGGKTRDITKVSDGGPWHYGDTPTVRAKGGRVGRQLGGASPAAAPPPGMLKPPPPTGQLPGLPGLGRAKGGRIGRWKGGPGRDVLGQKDVYASERGPTDETSSGPARDLSPSDMSIVPGEREYYNFIRGGLGHTAVGAPRGQGGIGSDETAEPTDQRRGGRIARAKGGRAKGKTVVNVIVSGKDRDQAQAPPPMAATGPVPPPTPPPAPPPRPPMMPQGMPMMPAGGAPMGPAGAPPGGGMPPGLPPGMGRATGGRISEKFGSGSGRGRLEKTKREGGTGRTMLPE